MILDDVQDRLIRNVESELDRQAIKGEKYRWIVICLSPKRKC